MRQKNFDTYEQLKTWCRENPNEYVYWGFIENMNGWYTTADLEEDMSPEWFEDEEGNNISVTIYIKEES